MPPKKKPKAKKAKPKTKQKQKQKQTQSQKVVINLATPSKRTRKPRATARPQTSRVLSQFVQPEQMFSSDRRTMINPMILPSQPFQQATRPPEISNTFAIRPPPIKEKSITGRDPLDAAEERRKQFLREEQSLSGFSDFQAPSTRSGIEPVSQSPPSTFDPLRDYQEPSEQSFIPQSISTDFTFATSEPSRLGLFDRRFTDEDFPTLNRPARGRPPAQGLRSLLYPQVGDDPRSAALSEGALSESMIAANKGFLPSELTFSSQ